MDENRGERKGRLTDIQFLNDFLHLRMEEMGQRPLHEEFYPLLQILYM